MKVIVAVHGIGDQYSFATIQSVVNRFCGYFGSAAGVPLGSFHTADKRPLVLRDPHPAPPANDFAFAEVYWAGTPRQLAEDKHTIEEAKQWAHTIVDRLRLRAKDKHVMPHLRPEDFELLRQVLGELIETIAVVDRICQLAKHAGLFSFALRDLLDNYLGDVQVVAEFGDARRQILETFADVMVQVHKSIIETDPTAEIYIVAHSEGTVVSLLGLLAAFREKELPPWAARVRGYMTLGSPIDKHLTLWPELFGDAVPPDPPRHSPSQPIQWRNYYDHGDPVGFALDDARHWIAQNRWERVFDFKPEHDLGFTRYPFPGKAHVDYWTDESVFGHFIENVVGAPNGATPRFSKPPATKAWAWFASYVMPYVGIFVLFGVASYVMYKAVTGALDPNGTYFEHAAIASRWVGGIAVLLSGITVAARVPRLTRLWRWRIAAVVGAAASVFAYRWSVSALPTVPLPHDPSMPQVTLPSPTMILNAGLVVLILGSILGALRPKWGLRPLMLAGAGAVAWIVFQYVDETNAPLWQVLLASALFLYLWWLGALLFDLVFVWHYYIRHANVLRRVDEMLGGRRSKQGDGAPPAASSAAAAPQVSA